MDIALCADNIIDPSSGTPVKPVKSLIYEEGLPEYRYQKLFFKLKNQKKV
jgi:hypothetical protein